MEKALVLCFPFQSAHQRVYAMKQIKNHLKHKAFRFYFISNKQPSATIMDDVLSRIALYFLKNSGRGKFLVLTFASVQWNSQ